MSNKPHAKTTTTTSVSIDPRLEQRAKERAKQRRQSFSGYIASLIDRDFETHPPVKKIA